MLVTHIIKLSMCNMKILWAYFVIEVRTETFWIFA